MRPRRRRRLSLLLVAPAAALLLLAAGGCGTGGLPEEGNTARGKELFINGQDGKQSCGSCHALADAGTTGVVGPDLDEAFRYGRQQGFKESTVRAIVANQIKFPAPRTVTRSDQRMPANLVTGDDVDAVASYVASVAGVGARSGGGTQATGGSAGGGGGAGGGTDGKAIFTSNCASCHTLAAADTSGTVGPNLDQAKPSRQATEQKVRKGGGGMPAFEGQLSDEQIQAVADYVAKNAGR